MSCPCSSKKTKLFISVITFAKDLNLSDFPAQTLLFICNVHRFEVTISMLAIISFTN